MKTIYDTQSYVDKNWKYFYFSLGYLATTLAIFGSGRENYLNFFGITLMLIPILMSLACINFRGRGIVKYNTYRKRLIEYITTQMSEEEIGRFLKARPIIKTLIEEYKKDKTFNWETIEDKVADEAFLLLYPKYRQLVDLQNKKIKEIKKETLYEPFDTDKLENIGVYFDRIIDKSRPTLFWIWLTIFIIYLFSLDVLIITLIK